VFRAAIRQAGQLILFKKLLSRYAAGSSLAELVDLKRFFEFSPLPPDGCFQRVSGFQSGSTNYIPS
jgi:hypothetical protein